MDANKQPVVKLGCQLLICIEFCKALDVLINHFPCNDWISNRTPSVISFVWNFFILAVCWQNDTGLCLNFLVELVKIKL